MPELTLEVVPTDGCVAVEEGELDADEPDVDEVGDTLVVPIGELVLSPLLVFAPADGFASVEEVEPVADGDEVVETRVGPFDEPVLEPLLVFAPVDGSVPAEEVESVVAAPSGDKVVLPLVEPCVGFELGLASGFLSAGAGLYPIPDEVPDCPDVPFPEF